MGPLSRAQIEQFKADGVLLLPGFVDAAQLESYRAQAWEALGCDRNDRSQWPKFHGNLPRELQPPPNELPQFRALIEQLGGGKFSPYHNSAGLTGVVRCIFPGKTAPDEWELPTRAHVDGECDDSHSPLRPAAGAQPASWRSRIQRVAWLAWRRCPSCLHDILPA